MIDTIIVAETKRCSKCGEVKPRAEFHKNRTCGDGLRSCCKICACATMQAYRAEKPEVAKETAQRYYQKNRDKIRVEAQRRHKENPEINAERCRQYRETHPEYYQQHREQHHASSRKYYRSHYDQERERARRWYEATRDVRLERGKQYRQDNRALFAHYSRERRTLEAQAAGRCSLAQASDRLSLWGGRCYRCGAMAEAMDHVKPLVKGGAAWPSNLRPICKTCNSRKGARWTGVLMVPPNISGPAYPLSLLGQVEA